MAIDVKFLEWIEKNFPGRDIPAHNDEDLHNHGSSTIKHGRGSVLTVDLTNRCNMMCDPCFMDANQVGYVHELTWEEIKEIMDNAMQIKPRRQMSIQFSGGEPTMSPYFLRAVAYARKLGYSSVQAATNGIEFAKSKEFAKKAAEAGLRYAYLQFDGIGNDANSHRQIGNLFDVKLRAINNLHEAGVEIILVVTLVNGVNNDQVGSIIRFAMDNPKKIAFIAFQPVSFTGRDEDITPERRLRQRYTLSHLANDVKSQVGITEPTRDWFPLSLMGAFADFADLVHGPGADWGQVSCGCHPNCGVGTALMINKETKEFAPVPQFLNIPGLVSDMQKITDSGRGKWFSNVMMGLALLKNYNPFGGPPSLTLMDIMKKFDKSFGLTRQELRQGHAAIARWTTSRSAATIRGTSCSSPECGSRICSTTTSAAPKCASFRTRRSWAKSPSVRTTPASAGGRSSRTCTRPRRSPSGTRSTASTASMPAAMMFRWTSFDHTLVLNPDGCRSRSRAGRRAGDGCRRREIARAAAREAQKMKQMMDELTFGKNLGSNEDSRAREDRTGSPQVRISRIDATRARRYSETAASRPLSSLCV